MADVADTPESPETTVEAQVPGVSLPRYVSIRDRWAANTRESLRRRHGDAVDDIPESDLGRLAGEDADARGPYILTEEDLLSHVLDRMAAIAAHPLDDGEIELHGGRRSLTRAARAGAIPHVEDIVGPSVARQPEAKVAARQLEGKKSGDSS